MTTRQRQKITGEPVLPGLPLKKKKTTTPQKRKSIESLPSPKRPRRQSPRSSFSRVAFTKPFQDTQSQTSHESSIKLQEQNAPQAGAGRSRRRRTTNTPEAIIAPETLMVDLTAVPTSRPAIGTPEGSLTPPVMVASVSPAISSREQPDSPSLASSQAERMLTLCRVAEAVTAAAAEAAEATSPAGATTAMPSLLTMSAATVTGAATTAQVAGAPTTVSHQVVGLAPLPEVAIDFLQQLQRRKPRRNFSSMKAKGRATVVAAMPSSSATQIHSRSGPALSSSSKSARRLMPAPEKEPSTRTVEDVLNLPSDDSESEGEDEGKADEGLNDHGDDENGPQYSASSLHHSGPAKGSFESIISWLTMPPELAEKGCAIRTGQEDASISRTRQLELEVQKQQLALAEGKLSEKSKKQYKSYLFPYKAFCDNYYRDAYEHRYDVTETKALVFMKQVMFPKRVRKYFPDSPIKDIRTAFAVRPPGQSPRDDPTLSEKLAVAPRTKDGRRYLDVPRQKDVMEQARKALIYLQLCQQARAFLPLPRESSIKANAALSAALNAHHESLVFGSFFGGVEPAAKCVIRSAYTQEQHIRCLLYALQLAKPGTGKWMREYLALSIRHSMVLRNEDLQNIALANIFMDQITDKNGGKQALNVLVFGLEHGKTNRGGKVQYGLAIRHHDVRRCSLGALAFYLFDLYENKRVPFPDFSQASWVDTKLIQGRTPTDPLDYTSYRETTAKVFADQEVECKHVTHSGRHSGAVEAQKLRVLEEDIKQAGRWTTGNSKLQSYYLVQYPIAFAVAMAGFKDEPFFLRRNELSPPRDLERKLFPEIESLFGPAESAEGKKWRAQCDREMDEYDPNNKDHLTKVTPFLSCSSSSSLMEEPQHAGDAHIRRTGKVLEMRYFCAMLLRLRRILIQDGAALLAQHTECIFPILQSAFFQTPDFLEFADQMKDHLTKSQVTDQGVAETSKGMLPDVTKALKLSNHQFQQTIAPMTSAVSNLSQQQQQQTQQQTQQNEQICYVLNKLANAMVDTQQLQQQLLLQLRQQQQQQQRQQQLLQHPAHYHNLHHHPVPSDYPAHGPHPGA